MNKLKIVRNKVKVLLQFLSKEGPKSHHGTRKGFIGLLLVDLGCRGG